MRSHLIVPAFSSMFNRTLALLAGAWAIVIGLHAQTITVVDNETGTPIEGAVVSGGSTSISLLTDVKGRVSINALLPADTIRIAALNYERIGRSPAMLGSEPRVRLVPIVKNLREVVVSANRWEQDDARVPDQITVIKPKDIAFQNPGTAADMLQQSGEVFMQKSQQGGGSPMLRGFAANRALIVVDGVRMNNAIYRAGNLQNVISVDPSSIERAEVIHGPGAMTYGSDAIGGVMDFHTLRPRFSNDSSLLIHGGAMGRYASAANERAGHLHVGIGGRKVSFLGSASFTHFGDLRAGTDGPADYLRPWTAEVINGVDSQVVNTDKELQKQSGYDNQAFIGKLAWKPMKALEIGANVYYSTTSDVPRYDRLIELRNGAPRSAEWYYGPQEWMMASLRATHTAERGPWSTARLIVSMQDYTESRNDRNFGNARLRTQTENVKGVWVNLDAEKELTSRTQLFYGAELVDNDVDSKGIRVDQETGEEQIINSRYPDGSTWSTGSVYAGLMHDVTERLTLSAGARFSWSALDCTFDTTLFPYPATKTSLSNSAITGNAGLAFRPDPSWKFSLDLSSGFRAPNIDDIGKVFDSAPGLVIVPNPDLEAEYAYNVEVGIEKTIAQRVKVGVTGYYNILENAMVRRPFVLNGQDSILYDGELSGVEAILNAAQATVTGVVFAVDANLGKGFALNVRYNWQDGEEEDDANTGKVPLRHCPPAFGQVGLSWERKKVRLQAYTQFSAGFTFKELPPSEQAKTPIYAINTEGEPYVPSWTTFNLKGSCQLTPQLLASAGVENITDQLYRPYSSGISAAGRNFIIALRAMF